MRLKFGMYEHGRPNRTVGIKPFPHALTSINIRVTSSSAYISVCVLFCPFPCEIECSCVYFECDYDSCWLFVDGNIDVLMRCQVIQGEHFDTFY